MSPHKFNPCETGGRLTGALESRTPQGDDCSLRRLLLFAGVSERTCHSPKHHFFPCLVLPWSTEPEQGSDKAAAKRLHHPVRSTGLASALGLRGPWNSRVAFYLGLGMMRHRLRGRGPGWGQACDHCRSTVAKEPFKNVLPE